MEQNINFIWLLRYTIDFKKILSFGLYSPAPRDMCLWEILRTFFFCFLLFIVLYSILSAWDLIISSTLPFLLLPKSQHFLLHEAFAAHMLKNSFLNPYSYLSLCHILLCIMYIFCCYFVLCIYLPFPCNFKT